MFQEMYQFVLEQIGKNDLIAGGAVLGALACILSYLRSVPFKIMYWSRLAFVTEVDIPDRTGTFNWINDWLAAHKYSKKAKRVTVEKDRSQPVVYPEGHSFRLLGNTTVTPAPGRHLIWWKGRPLIINRIRREGTGDNAHRAFRESWKISMFGNRKGLNDFIEECRSISEAEKDSTIKVSEADRGYWEHNTTRRKRPMDSVILPKGMRDELLFDVRTFIQDEKWYYEMNVPWRRGYLLVGPPGNGKSSLITAIASEIDFEICVANLIGADEDDLKNMMRNVPKNSILLLEDVDCLFREREAKSAISLSSLLNLLDGVNASEGRIVFMTTNHPELLDPALIRPGRIDMQLELTNACAYQAEKLYERFFPQCKNSEEFGTKVAALDVSMAKLQGYLLRHKESIRNARANIKELQDA